MLFTLAPLNWSFQLANKASGINLEAPSDFEVLRAHFPKIHPFNIENYGSSMQILALPILQSRWCDGSAWSHFE